MGIYCIVNADHGETEFGYVNADSIKSALVEFSHTMPKELYKFFWMYAYIGNVPYIVTDKMIRITAYKCADTNTDTDTDTDTMIGYYNVPGMELNVYGFFRKDGNVYVRYSHYTGYGYKPHTKKVYNLNDEPYFMHNGCRVHLYDVDHVSVTGGYVQKLGESVNIFDYIA